MFGLNLLSVGVGILLGWLVIPWVFSKLGRG